jgi:hypothetical protein
MPVILVPQEAEIRRLSVQSQPGQIVHETLSRKNPTHTPPPHTHKSTQKKHTDYYSFQKGFLKKKKKVLEPAHLNQQKSRYVGAHWKHK